MIFASPNSHVSQSDDVRPHEKFSGGPPPEGKAVDPVCGMHVDRAKARHIAEHAGRTYYFCCGGCKSSFVQNPAAYV